MKLNGFCAAGAAILLLGAAGCGSSSSSSSDTGTTKSAGGATGGGQAAAGTDVAALETSLAKTVSKAGVSGKLTAKCPAAVPPPGTAFKCKVSDASGGFNNVTVTLTDASGKSYKWDLKASGSHLSGSVSSR